MEWSNSLLKSHCLADESFYYAALTDFCEYLDRSKTVQASEIKKSLEESDGKCYLLSDSALEKINQHIETLSKPKVGTSKRSVRSECSKVSRSSKGTSKASSKLSAAMALSRAKADAAVVKLEYAEKKAELKKQQARLLEEENLAKASVARQNAELEADLVLLGQKKEAAAATAEAHALETFEENNSISQDSPFETAEGMSLMDPTERTHEYVTQQAEYNAHHLEPYSPMKMKTEGVPVELAYASCIPATFVQTHKPAPQKHAAMQHPSSIVPPVLDATAPPFIPNTTVCPQKFQSGPDQSCPKTPDPGPQNVASELTRFLLKKELLLSRLTHFNDKPESFAIWKTSFQSIMKELSVTSFEEMDLLVKWLGPESSKHALSIRTSNPNNPDLGLKRIWERLEERYGCPEMVESALKGKLANFPKISNKDPKKLYELADILSEFEAAKENANYKNLLAYFDSSSGVGPIVAKLPHQLQEKWTNRAVDYKSKNKVFFPPFPVFANFVREMSKIKNDPGFDYERCSQVFKETPVKSTHFRQTVSARITGITPTVPSPVVGLDKVCPVHKTKHSLNACRGFKAKPIEERRKYLKDKNICFRCCESDQHVKRTCKEDVKCTDCGSSSHPSALHIVKTEPDKNHSPETHGGEQRKQLGGTTSPASVVTSCLQICGTEFSGRSCAKNILVRVYPEGQPSHAQFMYAIVDDQSNRSLAKSAFFTRFDIEGTESAFNLSSCAGYTSAYGRRANGFIIESLNGEAQFRLPTLIECDQIPSAREEIPTPEIAANYSHLQSIQDQIAPLEDQADILLLIGRDLPEAHHILDQRIGPKGTPYAQRLHLGWVIIGETCLGKVHRPDSVNVNKTYLLPDKRTSYFSPCVNRINVKECPSTQAEIGTSVFEKTDRDEKPGLSVEDRDFLNIVNHDMRKSTDGNWVFPLPFRRNRPRLPNNHAQAMKRAKSLEHSLRKDPIKREHFISFMGQMLEKRHAEIAPRVINGEECWYLPIFGVYHPKKKDQIRVVFDSSAKYENTSLNDALLSGPDLTNSLLGILLRFRKERVAVTADIEKMFYGFLVKEGHRNFLRFLWYRDNDPSKDLIEYRMRVHVFGNSPSPAIATYGLHLIAGESESQFGSDIREFIEKDFYVDDGLVSLPTAEEAVDLMKRTQQALKEHGNLRLHKIASNDPEVMKAFPNEDLAKDLTGLTFDSDDVPLQRSLGMHWDLISDTYTFRVSAGKDTYTRRGVLSLVNSIFDPLGFAAPVTLQEKLFLRKFLSGTIDWDEPLPDETRMEWETWRNSLIELEKLAIPRSYSTVSFTKSTKRTIHVYCDASEKAISAVAYLVTAAEDNSHHVGFLLGKTKVAPPHGHTIPRLELCAAVLAVEIAEIVVDQLSLTNEDVRYYTDSRVVLGYINNKTRRFYVYVCNRVERILRTAQSEQWTYISTHQNPADSGTRCLQAAELQQSTWLLGPSHLHLSGETSHDSFPLIDPDEDNEIRPTVKSMKSKFQICSSLGSQRFERFSSWRRLVEAIAFLQQKARLCKQSSCGSSTVHEPKTVNAFKEAEDFVIKVVQHEHFETELLSLQEGMPLPKNSRLLALNPIMDISGIIRVGGRVNKADIPSDQRNPVILPGNHHISYLLVLHHHSLVKHQGRHFTEGAVRDAGLWIIGAKRLISSVIHKCVICRKLRGRQMLQQMADLPSERLHPGPPFTSVGVDTFGPWHIITRRTRGGQANSKRWAVLFTCLTTRAIHIEVVEEMSSSSFINALRRFISVRGNVKVFRSDRGTNFVGATDSLKIDVINVEDTTVKNFLYNKGTVWIFNPPHSSHMGGVWERMIGVARRILDSLLLGQHGSHLTHEVLTTFMAEVSAIVNSRPLVPVSTDPDCTQILTPSSLLTQKFDLGVVALVAIDPSNMYRAQWQRVQMLADMFWARWKREYLQTLQKRCKWQTPEVNLKTGDVVLLKDSQTCRGEWPMALIVNALESEDGKVRKAEVRVIKEGKSAVYTRPICELVLLLAD